MSPSRIAERISEYLASEFQNDLDLGDLLFRLMASWSSSTSYFFNGSLRPFCSAMVSEATSSAKARAVST